MVFGLRRPDTHRIAEDKPWVVRGSKYNKFRLFSVQLTGSLTKGAFLTVGASLCCKGHMVILWHGNPYIITLWNKITNTNWRPKISAHRSPSMPVKQQDYNCHPSSSPIITETQPSPWEILHNHRGRFLSITFVNMTCCAQVCGLLNNTDRIWPVARPVTPWELVPSPGHRHIAGRFFIHPNEDRASPNDLLINQTLETDTKRKWTQCLHYSIQI